jgi:hypothetical protein
MGEYIKFIKQVNIYDCHLFYRISSLSLLLCVCHICLEGYLKAWQGLAIYIPYIPVNIRCTKSQKSQPDVSESKQSEHL